ncbi:zinc finger protein SHOOT GRAVITROPISM 5-like [Aristolochia californica]|uniref:zinc finger protein SHOOT GRAVITROPISM 5-like n=1 Tax=Aristolochia californica TaxID=171875 RepID=UPI0035D9C8E2
MTEEDPRELPLFQAPSSTTHLSDSSLKHRAVTGTSHLDHHSGTSSLDLQLSISVTPVTLPPTFHGFEGTQTEINSIESLKRNAAEQIRLAAAEKAYADRVREMTRREMELAESDFAHAKHIWERAQQEVESARWLKEKATERIDSTCMEITCQACRRRFRASLV